MGSALVSTGVEWPAPGSTQQVARVQVCHVSIPGDAADVEKLAAATLSARETTRWQRFSAPWRRNEWLIGRVAAKALVCEHLRLRLTCDVRPAEVEIEPDARGCPRVVSPWLDAAAVAPLVSIAHADGLAVAALVADGAMCGVGVDLEPVGRVNDAAALLAFDDDERALLPYAATPGAVAEWRARFWCAKEAVAKALGVGLLGGPRVAAVCDVAPWSGDVSVRVTGGLAAAARALGADPSRLMAHTTTYETPRGNVVVAVATL